MTDEEPLDTEMEGKDGTPDAVAKLFETSAAYVSKLPDDMRLNVEIRVWEVVEDD